MHSFLRKLPIEATVLLLPCIVYSLCIGIVGALCLSNVLDVCTTFIENLGRMPAITRSDLAMITSVTLLLTYLAVRTVILMRKGALLPEESAGKQMCSFLFVFGIIYACSVAVGLSVCMVFSFADPVRSAWASSLLMRADFLLFRTYPPLALNTLITSNRIGEIIMQAYLLVVPMLSIALILLPFRSTRLFRTFVLSYFLSLFIAFPIWITIPAIQPDSMYRENILNTFIPAEIEQSFQRTPWSKGALAYSKKFNTYWTDPQKTWLSVTNFPSMHAAWGVILAWIIIEAWPLLGVLAVPWVILELIGTMYSVQHYAVDTGLGILVALLAIFVSKRFLRYEKQFHEDRYDLLLCQRTFESDFRRLLQWITSRPTIGQRKKST
jgi:hypothetical protein